MELYLQNFLVEVKQKTQDNKYKKNIVKNSIIEKYICNHKFTIDRTFQYFVIYIQNRGRNMKIQNTGIENKITKSIEKNKLIQSKILKSIH